MDSPDRNQEPPVNDTQGSPFFKFLCSLSPIKQVKSLHVVQSYSELTFPAAPTVFASPQLDQTQRRAEGEQQANSSHQYADPNCGSFPPGPEKHLAESRVSRQQSAPAREAIDLNERLSEPSVDASDGQPAAQGMPTKMEVEDVSIANLKLSEDTTNTEVPQSLKALDVGQRGFRRCLDFEAPNSEEPCCGEVEPFPPMDSLPFQVKEQENIISSQGSSIEVAFPLTKSEESVGPGKPPNLSLPKDELQCSPVEQDLMQSYSLSDGEDTSPESPKRRKAKQTSRGGCKRCKCKKSRCLKLYCECFSAGVYCVGSCTCRDCFNNSEHTETVIEARQQIENRNPLAFAPKVIRTADASPSTGEDNSKTPASARHKRGCNCKKSLCLKKYCECYQVGVGCSDGCKCDGCQNIYGKKEGQEIPEAPRFEQELPDDGRSSSRNLSPTTPHDSKPYQGKAFGKSGKKKRPVDQLGSPLPTSGSQKPRKSRLIPCADIRPCPALSPLADPPKPCPALSPLADSAVKQAAPSPRWDGLDDICTLTPLPQHPTRPTPSSTVTSERSDDPFGEEKATPTFPLLFPAPRDSGCSSMEICGGGQPSPPGFRKLVLQASPNPQQL